MKDIKKVRKRINKLFQQNKLGKAESEILKLLKKYPDDVEFNSLLGRIYIKKNDPEMGLVYNKKVTELLPENANAHLNVALCYKEMGNILAAIESLLKAVQLNGQHQGALAQLGTLYYDLYRLDDAEKTFFKLLKIKEDAYVHVDLSRVYVAKGLFGKAEEHLKKSLAIEPVNPPAYNNLALIYYQSCRHGESYENYRRAFTLDENIRGIFSNYLFGLHYDDSVQRDYIFQEHLRWADVCTRSCDFFKTFQNLPIKKRRLRIGYLSSDLRVHSVGFFMLPIFMNHSSEFEMFVYYNYPGVDSFTEKFQAKVPVGWRTIHALTDKMAADVIRKDRIDILVELSGHTSGTRIEILAQKPAPIQVTYLGYPDTTGLKTIDYRLTDELADPVGETEHLHTEHLYRLEKCFLSWSAPNDAPSVKMGMMHERNGICLGSFNSSAKISNKTIALWSKLLTTIENSSLLLKSSPFADNDTTSYVKKQFYAQGVGENQLTLMGFLPLVDGHLDLYNKIDIALDPYPYNGTTTTFEALYMGCPVVTLVGDRHSARVGLSILSNLGLNECIAYSEEEYLEKVRYLASDKQKLFELKKSLRSRLQNSVLMDHKGFTRKLENAFREMWNTWCDNAGTLGTAVVQAHDGFAYHLPDSLEVFHTFVLREQERWFEQELDFLSTFLKPGMKAIDVGANFGFYLLNIAKIVGESGSCLAFEPSSDFCSYLRLSIHDNGLANIKVIEGGLAAEKGGEMLPVIKFPDNVSVDFEQDDSVVAEYVRLLTLDETVIRYGFNHDLDFLRIDAAGKELNILEGAQTVLKEQSPLILYDLAGEGGFNYQLCDQLEMSGYKSYYLIPGLNVLAPFEKQNTPDSYLLNVFACKEDRALALVQEGLLCRSIQVVADVERDEEQYHKFWQEKIFYSDLQSIWEHNHTSSAGHLDYIEVLNWYIKSQDTGLATEERVGLLFKAFSDLGEICEMHPTLARLLSLVRMAQDTGNRKYAVGIIDVLLNLFENSTDQLQLDEPHLAATKRYDSIAPGSGIGEWCLSSILEAKVELEYFSLYMDEAGSALPLLEMLANLGFQSTEMERRRQLLLIKTGKLDRPEPSEVLEQLNDDNLNPEWWKKMSH
ncbi:FkbM family methyltransferase [Desulfopila sp. IMCC35008]|uniref:FkbM family methyltransferase n=1 Tax=Desulfopila sp. IMCC35008 TaxID=2653858 RepID=UPI0013D0DB1A|nr:FkbM family methyltransferase [Desulfopila sp. IMCC35008]